MIQHKDFSWIRNPYLWLSTLFLVAYWGWGYDGITFSDDVFYLVTGQAFWEGNEVVNDYHFSSRIGSYVFSGFLTYLFGFSDRVGSIASLLAYLGILILTVRILDQKSRLWAIPFLLTQVYFLHFLTKVYPDSLLAFWVILIPIAAISRHSHPYTSALLLTLSLLVGFMTKETMVFLFPFPFLLFYLDCKSKQFGSFHLVFISFAILFTGLYLGYYWWAFGDPLYRIQSVHEGHYISEYTFFDKDWKAMLWRVSFSPLVTFVERGYWLWVVLAMPAVVKGLKSYHRVTSEFGLALVCMLVGFWWMSTSLEYYNPLYLNPRHLIIIVPISAVLIGMGAKFWLEDSKTRNLMVLIILIGALIGILIGDWKQTAFLSLFGLILWSYTLVRPFLVNIALMVMLLLPAIYSAHYQQQLKGFTSFTKVLQNEVNQGEVVAVNNFVAFSKEVLLPYQETQQALLFPIERLDAFEELAPVEFTLLIYAYHTHAYPKEIPDVEEFLELIAEMGYVMISEKEDKWLKVRRYGKGKRKG